MLGGVFGGAGGLISSAISQKISGGKVNWKEAWGAAANGAITGAAQGGLLASGAGIPVALATNFLAGTAGSAVEQYISTGEADARKSITNGLNNAVSNLIYGTDPLGSVKEAFGRGFGAGAATSAINYLSDLIGQKPAGSGVKAELLSGIAGGAVSPFAAMRDPRRGCGSTNPFRPSLGYSTARGYRYDAPLTANRPQSRRRGFSLKDFLGQTLLGGLTGGFSSAAFYGAGKGIEALKTSIRKIDDEGALSIKFLSGDDDARAVIEESKRLAGPSTDKEFKVVGHGNSKGIMEDGKQLNAAQVAQRIQSSSEYIGGEQKVILFACNTGKDPNGFAQQLADILEVVVEAPDKDIQFLPDGRFVVGNQIKQFRHKRFDPGNMISFEPRPKR